MRRLLGACSAATLCAIFAVALWPYHAPSNHVSWISHENGLQFEHRGTAVSAGEFPPQGVGDSPCSLEVWVKPDRREDSKTILAFHTAQNPVQLELRQSLTDLYLGHASARKPRGMYIQDLCRTLRPIFLTVSSGANGTAIYLDSALLRTARGFRITAADCSGRLVLGTSPVTDSAWSGQLRGIAVYDRELSREEVARHYWSWTRSGTPDLTAGETCAALYLFDEHGGAIVHNRCGSGPDLDIPAKYEIVDQIFLEPFWDAIDIPDMLRNVVAFVPLGFFLCGYFSCGRRGKANALAVTVLGGLLSLAIEVVQSHLPTRQSDTMDVITNTVGVCLGVVAWRFVEKAAGQSRTPGNPGPLWQVLVWLLRRTAKLR
ncbi:MAG: VanZ family protein [Acidobacteria bacterium]|nr:VanZ family protein [Acidobacteriota bacterium]